jgi:hypothetical protein
LEKLHKFGIVTRDGYLWSISIDATSSLLAEAAYKSGTAGHFEKKQRRHHGEREQFASATIFRQIQRHYAHQATKKGGN